MKKEIDIYDFERKFKSALKNLERAPISNKNKELILQFRDQCSLDNLSQGRIIRYIVVLRDWAKILEKDFDKATKQDLMSAVRIIQEKQNYTAWTKATYKKMLKRFYRWLKNNPNPEEITWIKSNIKRSEQNLPANGDLLTENEVKKLIEVAEHLRDKALVSTLYESGARIGEIASLQIGNVKIDEYGIILHVKGKTGSRPIRIIASTPHLMAWLQCHPLKDDANAPLWINTGNVNHYSMAKYDAIRNMLIKLFAKAGMKKRANPHMFRHSRATFMADHLTEFQMNQYFGWIQGSNMPSTYVHMSGKRIDNSILEMNGLKRKDSSNESKLKPKVCNRCRTINEADSKFCRNCAGILDMETASEMQAKEMKEQEMRKKSDQLMNLLMKEPKLGEVIRDKLKELGLEDKGTV